MQITMKADAQKAPNVIPKTTITVMAKWIAAAKKAIKNVPNLASEIRLKQARNVTADTTKKTEKSKKKRKRLKAFSIDN